MINQTKKSNATSHTNTKIARIKLNAMSTSKILSNNTSKSN